MSAQPEKSKFYIVCQPGFESELELELKEFWPYLINTQARPHVESFKTINIDHGGILIEASPIAAYQINFFSKIASRVLERKEEFRVRDFPKLKAKFDKINLESRFGKNSFKLEISASKSRLNNEKRIEEIANTTWKNIKNEADLSVHIRMYDDICTVSIDTSGEHLHFRNADKSKWVGEAPLRETIAAFCVRKLIGECSIDELEKITLFDPMAGSGTLLLEAYQLYQPHFYERKYSFQFFLNCPKILKAEQLAQNYPSFKNLFKNIIAFDNDDSAVKILKKNLTDVINKEVLIIKKQDVFSQPNREDLQGKPRKKLWIILNPPYGERLAFPMGFQKLGEAIAKHNTDKIGIIAPVREILNIQKGLKGYNLDSRWAFKNGGISVEFLVFKLKLTSGKI